MRVADLGIPLLPFGTNVFCTHRASGVKHGSLRDVRAGTMPVRQLLWNHEVPTSPERPRLVSQPPAPLSNWVVAWPEHHYGVIVGLTHRAEGFYNPGGGYGYSAMGTDPGDPEPPYLEQVERHPLYEVRWALNGHGVLVPPWAVYPLTENLVKFDHNLPIPVGQPEPEYRALGIAFQDYALSLPERVEA